MSLASLSSDGIHSDQILQSTWHWFPPSHTPCRFCCRHNLSWCVSHPLLHSHRDCSPTSGSQTSLFWPAGFSVSVLLSQLFLLSGPASLPPHQQSLGWPWPAPALGWRGRTPPRLSVGSWRSRSGVSSFSFPPSPSVCLVGVGPLQHLPGHTATHNPIFKWKWPPV